MLITFLSGHSFAQNSSSSDTPPHCEADVRWTNTNANVNYSKGLQAPISISLLTQVSKGSNCSNAEIRLTATFLNSSQEYICSGTILQAMTISSEVQTFNLEIRPFTQNDFLRWRNQPGARGLQKGKELTCMNVDGTSDVGDVDRVKAAMIHLAVAVLPSGGGLAVAEALIRVNP